MNLKKRICRKKNIEILKSLKIKSLFIKQLKKFKIKK